MNHPLLDVDIVGATGALIHVTGGSYMTLEQANQVVELMTAELAPDAQVIVGARQDPAFGDTIKVMSIITGVAGDRLSGGSMAADLLGDVNVAVVVHVIARKGSRDEDGLHNLTPRVHVVHVHVGSAENLRAYQLGHDG